MVEIDCCKKELSISTIDQKRLRKNLKEVKMKVKIVKSKKKENSWEKGGELHLV